MNNINLGTKDCRFSKEYELKAWLKLFMHPLDTLEEHHLHLSIAISHPHTHSLDCVELHSFATLSHCLLTSSVQIHSQHLCTNLNVGHIWSGVTDASE